jgi:hypothetical protein
MLLRAGLSHSLSQEGCRSGITVNEKRGKARVNISEALGHGRRRQVPLPIDWSAENVDAIRDAALVVYRSLVAGKPIEPVIASLVCKDDPGNGMESAGPEAESINWPALVEAFRERKLGSGEIKPTTWTNNYVRRMRLILVAIDRCQTPVQLLEAVIAPWASLHSCAGELIRGVSLQPGRLLLI